MIDTKTNYAVSPTTNRNRSTVVEEINRQGIGTGSGTGIRDTKITIVLVVVAVYFPT